MDQGKETHCGPLAEFVALRNEIVGLTELQWKAMAFQVTTAGAVFGFALSSPGRIPLLLIIPFSSYVLCARWIMSHELVKRAATYIRTQLDPNVPGGLGYEDWKREREINIGIRPVVRLPWSSPTVLMFPSLAVLALSAVGLWFFTSAVVGPRATVVAGIMVWAFGVLLVLLSLRLIWTGHHAKADTYETPTRLRSTRPSGPPWPRPR